MHRHIGRYRRLNIRNRRNFETDGPYAAATIHFDPDPTGQDPNFTSFPQTMRSSQPEIDMQQMTCRANINLYSAFAKASNALYTLVLREEKCFQKTAKTRSTYCHTYYYWYSITHSLFHLLKSFLFCKSSLPQPFLFLLQDSLYGFPRLFTVTSEHIRLFTF